MGICSPRKILKFRSYEIASETIFRSRRCLSEARRQSFTRMSIYSFYPLRRTLVLVSASRSVLLICQKLHPLQLRLARLITCKNGKLLAERLSEQLCRIAHDHHANFNLVPVCLGALRGVCQACHAGKPWVKVQVVLLKPD